MDVETVMTQVKDALTVKRVFGEPYEKNGATVIPVAKVQGGAGGGTGEDERGAQKGSGTGFGLSARPIGAFVIKGDQMTWRPAVDVNRIILGGQVVAIVALLTIRSIVKARAKASE
ncbi:MAG: sporulation protein [Actinomycetota bacterium]|nr:sporulation protein [Actinomycetota bacterium]